MKKWNKHVGKLAFFDKKGMLCITHAKVKKIPSNKINDNDYMVIGFDYHYIIFGNPFGMVSNIRKKYVKILD